MKLDPHHRLGLGFEEVIALLETDAVRQLPGGRRCDPTACHLYFREAAVSGLGRHHHLPPCPHRGAGKKGDALNLLFTGLRQMAKAFGMISLTNLFKKYKESTILKIFIPITLTLLGVEMGSRIVAYQPIMTTYKKLHQNGVSSNIENSSAIHEFWDNGIKVYTFGEYANRISSNESARFKHSQKISHKDSCNYLVLGDSFSFGYLVDYEEAFPTLIESYLNNNNNNDEVIRYINAASPGWGLADYPAYLDVYKNKLNKANLSGIIVFINSGDAKRASISGLYNISNNNNSISVARSNKAYASKSGFIKRFLSHPLVAPVYNASQTHSNTARLLKNIFLNKLIYINPRKYKTDDSGVCYAGCRIKLSQGSTVKENQSVISFSSESKAKINQSVLDLHQVSSEIAPLLLIYVGTSPQKSWQPENRYFFLPEGREFLSSTEIMFDFSTTKSSSTAHRIKFNAHPNALGHRKIAENILNSQSESSLKTFTESTCIKTEAKELSKTL